MSGENILKGCLVESDPGKISRARQAKCRALLVAIILQVLLVGLLLLAPLLGAVEKLPWTTRQITPVPPYKGGPKPSETKIARAAKEPRKLLPTEHTPVIVAPRSIPPVVATIVDPPEVFADRPESAGNNIIGDPKGILDLDAPNNRSATPPKPAETPTSKPKKGPVEVSPAVQAARLILRVEPKYPSPAKSAGIEGKVVLRAVIAKDGTIQSLEVVSGNPLFIETSREAIAQWRYQPTLLHGAPVEVETLITIVFTLRR
ncbi:MAG TPA: TonB family protein [Candidatus Acidoferrales bacterium]|nr:TonB family protein [Candidatus Acidoferrales bacterium]